MKLFTEVFRVRTSIYDIVGYWRQVRAAPNVCIGWWVTWLLYERRVDRMREHARRQGICNLYDLLRICSSCTNAVISLLFKLTAMQFCELRILIQPDSIRSG